ncbi:AAA family ATPase [Aureimonas sp. AU40]|uniref:AAA family ATPase n=1 Tax=Aureimonas sp. AU40 TaxID=1637747 RepID=UPI000783E548|nr:CpaE family protein [Aureimonas sp. AU40]
MIDLPSGDSPYRLSDTDLRQRLDALRPVPRISIQAFCETAAVGEAIEAAAGDRRMVKAHVRVHMGGIRAAVEHYATAPTPNLVFLESTLRPNELLGELESLADVCDPGSKVVIVGHHNDVSLYRELTRRGVSEYMLAPVHLADVLAIVSQLFMAEGSDPLGRILAFVGAKGGAGASTLCHNVGWTMARLFGNDVLLADLDLPFGTANIDFDRDPPQGVAEAVFSAERLDEVFLDRLLVSCADHLSLLAAPSTLDRAYDFEAEAFSALIDAAQRGTPHVVLDVPHVWNGWTRTVLERADEVVLVAEPDLANLRNAKNLMDTLRKARPNDRPPHLVLNRVGVPKRPEIAPAEFAEPLGVQLMAQIAFDPLVFGTAANTGRMLAELDGKHAATLAFNEMAHALTGRAVAKQAPKQALGGLRALMRRR